MADIDTRLGLDSLSLLGLPPVESIKLAADLGCAGVSLTLAPWPYNPHGYPGFSLRDDAQLRADTVATLKARGIRLTLGEVFMFRRDPNWDDITRDLDIFAELGAEQIVMLSLDADLGWSFDQFAQLNGLAAERGLGALVEFVAGMPIGRIATARQAVAHVDHPNFGMLIDMMHVGRSGGTAADIAAIDPGLIRYAQICDVAAADPYPDQPGREAVMARLAPGDGALPLVELMGALPDDVFIGLEIPQGALAEQGIGPDERMRHCLAATREVLAKL